MTTLPPNAPSFCLGTTPHNLARGGPYVYALLLLSRIEFALVGVQSLRVINIGGVVSGVGVRMRDMVHLVCGVG